MEPNCRVSGMFTRDLTLYFADSQSPGIFKSARKLNNETGTAGNRTILYKYNYSFTVNETEYQEVLIIYNSVNPSVSRMEGLRLGMVPVWLMAFGIL